MLSGDLEQLLQQGSLLPPDGAASLFAPGRAPSFNIGKLESLNLPEEALAAAMLQMERAGMGASLPLPRAAQQAAAAPPPAQGEQQQEQQRQTSGGEQRAQAQASPAPQGKGQSPAPQQAGAGAGGGSPKEGGGTLASEGRRVTPQKRKA